MFHGGGMDFSMVVGKKFLSSVRSARSLGLLPPLASDRPEVPARAAAAAVVARAIAGLPLHPRYCLSASSEELSSIFGSRQQEEEVEEVKEEFYEEEFDPVRHILEHIPLEENEQAYFEKQILQFSMEAVDMESSDKSRKMIACTQPQRVAAMSMSCRVTERLILLLGRRFVIALVVKIAHVS